MAHHAKIENGIVTQVIVTCDSDEDTFADRMLAETGEQWVRTSFNNRIRFNFAGEGYTYDPVADAFIAPNPNCGHPESFLDTATYRWNCDNDEHNTQIL
jgi:hypothetical protein